MITLDDAKNFLRVDGTEDDGLIQALITASAAYIANAVGDTVDTTSPVYDQAQRILVVHWYENREPVGQANVLAYSLESMILQLRYTAPPKVTVSPADGATGVLLPVNVMWAFSQPVASYSVTLKNFYVKDAAGVAVSGALSLSADGLTVAFVPTDGFAAGVTYAATVTAGVRFVSGEAFPRDVITSFTTA